MDTNGSIWMDSLRMLCNMRYTSSSDVSKNWALQRYVTNNVVVVDSGRIFLANIWDLGPTGGMACDSECTGELELFEYPGPLHVLA